MIDTRFYRQATDRLKAARSMCSFDELESLRSRTPTVYNIETTNACPMHCRMCPRTTLMKRPVATMSMLLFKSIVDQLQPPTVGELVEWTDWCEREFGIALGDGPSENRFFLHVIPHVIQLHGYGEPLVDKHMPERVAYLSKRGLHSYFSCNPSVLDVGRFTEVMRAGLSVVKFSIESTDDARFQSIRGSRANFTESYAMIRELLDVRARERLATAFVVTMLDLGEPDRAHEFQKLLDAFRELPVYCYLKGQDTTWYTPGATPAKSIHWTRPCLHPWASMTVLADGTVGACMETYDSDEFTLGNAANESLADIWNGARYTEFRRAHVRGCGLPSKCTQRCDMPRVGP